MIKQIYMPFMLAFAVVSGVSLSASAALPSEKALQTAIENTKKLEQTEENKQQLQLLEDTLAFMTQTEKVKADNDALVAEITGAHKAIAASKANFEKLKAQTLPTSEKLAEQDISALQALQEETQAALEKAQNELTATNTKLIAQNAAPDKAQASLSANAKRKSALNTELANSALSDTAKNKIEAELALLDAQNSYSQTLLRGNEELSSLYNARLDEKKQAQQNQQQLLSQIQEALNIKLVQASKNKVEEAEKSQQKNKNTNPVISKELDFNTSISEELLKKTTEISQLSQDNLRIKNVLDNLQQTQRNIEEQISSLQGTLVLSRIINKQRQSLPQDKVIKGLSKQIADLRVRVFDISEFKDSLVDTQAYISKLESREKTTFTDAEKAQLEEILQTRSKTLSELLKLLNNQLNLSINIELNQQQVKTISDALQQKLQQQSFWVKSNSEMDLEWFTRFPGLAGYELTEISKKLDFSNWKDNLGLAGLLIGGLSLLTFFIRRQHDRIKQKLTKINNSMLTVPTDSQWNTPMAIFWTVVLCLPSTFMFLIVFVLVTYICFLDPTEVWPWGLKMAFYWLYFAFMLAMLRPNGIAYRHFNMPQSSNAVFRKILKHSVWVIGLLLNTSIFNNATEYGIAYDVIGQAMTVLVLISVLFVVVPGFRMGIATYQKAASYRRDAKPMLLGLVRILLVLAPIALIVLIVMGYYYTASQIIEHLVASYFAIVTWIIIRNMVYRGFNVSSRRLSYRRLQEKRALAQAKAQAQQNGQEQTVETEDSALVLQDDAISVSDIKNQMLKITDLVLWTALFGLLYWVWSDLVTVAYYLKEITLWQQATTTEAGTVMESITLLNLLVAMIVLIVTYILVKNLGGLLETLVFSNLNLSQGTPYTITTIFTYLLIIIGASIAFASLGMSWSKLQWLFTALSVGLGFGMQEIFGNFVSGIIILFERPVRVGDMVTIGSFNGTVSKIRIRATTLIDNDRKEVIVPNKAFITERVVNWALTSSMTRLVITVGVAYGSDLELVKRLLLQAAEENEAVLKDPAPAAYFLSFGASTLDHELRVYVGQLSDRVRTIDALNRRIDELFMANNIEIAFNQLDIFIKNQATNEEVKWGTEPLVPVKK
ncbi:transporter, small conductance mechanosensitive ion channel MscS family protein [Haemophilus sputorum HK 2154]|uniref:mechanosensitive channel MscK n=1 Tax=Haemophilus sputorum TaxID=1078480 RepID=UPI00027A5FE0|nr:mechanosensitive channel MscK [Haemophilus sputorum]EJP29069.1 transporter, small conductance mechanosensitive ion channel MscS family protein [Haemophilus sputorum HK 2154]